MDHLTDFEDLLAKVKSEEMRKFIAEAFRCYAAGAYRGAIVIASIALFEDLRRKLAELATINPEARKVCSEIEQRVRDQELFESYLSDQLASVGILSQLEKSILNRLREHRNKAAHPTGHAPSAEEARYVLHEIVTRFLERPTLYATQRVDELCVRLKSDNYFPSNLIPSITSIVSEEIEHLHPGVFPYLIKELRSSIDNTSGRENTNCCFFMVGLSSLSAKSEDLRDSLRKHYIEKVSEILAHGDTLLSCSANNPELIRPSEQTLFTRFVTILDKHITELDDSASVTSQNHPCQVFDSFFEKMGPAFTEKHLLIPFTHLMEKRPYEPTVARIAFSLENIRGTYVAKILQKASSSSFTTANEAAQKIAGLDVLFAENLSPSECLDLVGAFLRAASWGAWSALSLGSERFLSIANVKRNASAAIDGMAPQNYTMFASKHGINLETKESFLDTYF